jgi:hypothetical protein
MSGQVPDGTDSPNTPGLISHKQQALDVAAGLAFLHSHDVVHGNLTPVSCLPIFVPIES